jgi:hypothetical protein
MGHATRHQRLRHGESNGSNRVNRGGSWNNNASNVRAANRNNDDPANRNNNLGFRLASPEARSHKLPVPESRVHGPTNRVTPLTMFSKPVPAVTRGPKMPPVARKCGGNSRAGSL